MTVPEDIAAAIREGRPLTEGQVRRLLEIEVHELGFDDVDAARRAAEAGELPHSPLGYEVRHFLEITAA